MPQPDQELPDGTKVYSLDGLKKLNEWNRQQARKEALDEVNKQYGGIREEWEAHQRIQAALPHVQAQINEARTWPQFTENEEAITKALVDNPTWGLERAYQAVVLPKIQASVASAQTDRATLEKQIRKQVLEELQKAPRATSAPASSSRPSPASSGPRDIESVIRDSIQALK
jgi:hypothetical protein